VYQLEVHTVEELLDIWHGLQQNAVDSAIDAYRPKEESLSSDNMLIE